MAVFIAYAAMGATIVQADRRMRLGGGRFAGRGDNGRVALAGGDSQSEPG
jgi:hypothetical protein